MLIKLWSQHERFRMMPNYINSLFFLHTRSNKMMGSFMGREWKWIMIVHKTLNLWMRKIRLKKLWSEKEKWYSRILNLSALQRSKLQLGSPWYIERSQISMWLSLKFGIYQPLPNQKKKSLFSALYTTTTIASLLSLWSLTINTERQC